MQRRVEGRARRETARREQEEGDGALGPDEDRRKGTGALNIRWWWCTETTTTLTEHAAEVEARPRREQEEGDGSPGPR